MCIKSVFEFMYLVVSLVVLRAGCGIWLYQFLIISYLFTFPIDVFETCSKWLKWQEVSVDINILSLGDCPPLSCGYIHLLNHEKMSMKSEVEQMTKVMRPSCWHQNVGPNVLSAPAQELYTCRNHEKVYIKSEGIANFWNMQSVIKVIRPFCFHQQNCPQGLSHLALGLDTL